MDKARFVTLDIETTTHEGKFYGHSYETNIKKITHYGQILCFAWKELGKKVHVYGWQDVKRGNKELGVVKKLWEVIDGADVLIGHNLKNFDLKWCNTKFAKFGLLPPSPYKTVDTLLDARKYLALPDNSLDGVADYFGLEHKKNHDPSIWEGCLAGDRNSWYLMKAYVAWDVGLTEQVFYKLRPYAKNKYDYLGRKCPYCGSQELWKRGLRVFGAKFRQEFQCQTCGHYSRTGAKPDALVGL